MIVEMGLVAIIGVGKPRWVVPSADKAELVFKMPRSTNCIHAFHVHVFQKERKKQQPGKNGIP